MRLTSLVFGVGVVCSVVGCDQLTLPQRPSGNGQSPIDITNANQTIVQGETTDLYGAPATAWAVMNAQTNELTAFKWSLPLSSVTNVPPNTSALRAWLDIPQEVLEQTPFVGFTYDYMPVGHSPPGIYDVSHWEFHINTAARETIEAIDCSDPTFPPDDRLPIPFNEWFVVPPPLNCWPGMGIHVSHRRAPEFSGQRFTRSMGANYYAGELVALEVKITRELLLARESFSLDVPIISIPNYTGQFPSKLQVDYVAQSDTYVWSLTNFIDPNAAPAQ